MRPAVEKVLYAVWKHKRNIIVNNTNKEEGLKHGVLKTALFIIVTEGQNERSNA